MPLRPTPDSMRERAFQILGADVVDVDFLDLFAGTGIVGLEALSRGAASTVFVEKHQAAARLLRGNVDLFPEARDRTSIVCLEAVAAIRRFARLGESFDIAWADPPFPTWEDGAEALAAAFAENVLKPGGIACLECPDRADLSHLPESLKVVRDLTGGASRLVILSLSDRD